MAGSERIGFLKHVETMKGPYWLVAIYLPDPTKDKRVYRKSFDAALSAAYRVKPIGSQLVQEV